MQQLQLVKKVIITCIEDKWFLNEEESIKKGLEKEA
jgi:hypothetical protein